MLLPPAGSLPSGAGLPGNPADPRGQDLAGLEDLAEPSEAELAGCWPDPFAGRPEDCDDWCADQAADPADVPGPVFRPGTGFAEGEVLDELGPGPALAGFSQRVLDEGLAGLSDDELVGVLRASRRLAAWQDGVELAAVIELDARRVGAAARPRSSLTGEQVAAELAAALVLTGRSADALLGLARELVRLPAVRRTLLAGLIDLARAKVFAEELAGLGNCAAAAVAAAFADLAGQMTTGQLRAALKSMVLWLDPAAARKRAEQGKAQARVEAWQEGSGNMGLAGRELPAADAIAADKRLTAIARALQAAGAPGTLDQLRAAVFTALLAGREPETLLPAPAATGPRPEHPTGTVPAGSGGPDSGQPPTADLGGLSGLTGTVHLVMPAAAWLGRSDAPGEAAGLGPLDAWTCRDLADRLAAAGAATSWSVILTGSDGRAVATAAARAGPGPPGGPPDGYRTWLAGLTFDWLERGTCSHPRQVRGYQPGHRLRNLICARQRTCSFPGCRRPAVRSDLDHTIPHDQGGRSCECNLSPLCRMHHHVKQGSGWTLTQPEPGVLTWTAPNGRSYTVTPDRYLS